MLVFKETQSEQIFQTLITVWDTVRGWATTHNQILSQGSSHSPNDSLGLQLMSLKVPRFSPYHPNSFMIQQRESHMNKKKKPV